MLLSYPNELEAWRRDLQYLWGESLLVAPALGATPSPVWLPQGLWYDFWTDAPLTGARVMRPRAVTGLLPLYVKAGAIIPRATFAPSTSFINYDALTLHIYAGASGSTTLYNDDGISEHFQSGAAESSAVTFDTSTLTTDIAPVSGSFNNATTRTLAIALHGLTEPKCLSWNNTPLAFAVTHDALSHSNGTYWDAARHILYAQLPTLAKTQSIHIAATSDCRLPQTSRFEAEAATIRGTIAQKPTASGGSYVGQLEANDAQVTFTLAFAGDTTVALRLGLANGSTKTATRHVRIDGQTTVPVSVAPTNDWDSFAPVDVWMGPWSQGPHTITLYRDSLDQQTLDVDYLDVVTVP